MTNTITQTRTNPSSPTPTRTDYSALTRSKHDSGRAVPTALKSEWIKLSSIRSNKAILGLTVGVSGVVSWAVAKFVTDAVLTVSEVFTFATVFTAVFAAVAGILLFSSEAQHRTLGLALTGQPTRSVIAVSKTMMAAAFGVVLGAAGLIAGYAGASLAGIGAGDTSTIIETSMWAVMFVSFASVLGLGVGMIARHSTAAISGLLVWWLVVENLLNVFVAARFSRFLPFVAGNGLLAIEDETASSESLAVALTRTEDALIFGGYAVIALIIGSVLLHRRDTN